MTPHSTGATGYIGGDALFAVQEAQPTWNISVLIRNEEKGAQVKKSFPKVEVVIGGLDDYNIIKDAASKSDIVIRKDTSTRYPKT